MAVGDNILFLCADDLCHTNRLLNLLIRDFDLPNLRRLQNSATDFDRAYCVVPICEPARTAMMTGMSPADTKSFDLSIGWKQLVKPRNLWTYRLREAGYWMGTVGKIFHGYGPQPQSVYDELYDDEPFNIPAWNPSGEGTEWGGMYGTGWDNETDWYDYAVAQHVIDFLADYDEDRPFYQEAGFYKPHVPFQAPNRIFASIDMNRVIIPTSWQGGFDTLPFANEFITANTGYGTDPATWSAEDTLYVRQTIRNYGAAALWMDEQLGRILDALEASRFASNTIVSFYSDHGYHLSDHGKWHKFTLYEQAALAPMVVKATGATPRKVTTPVSHIDLGPTLLDLVGIPKPPGMRGESLKPWIQGQTPAARPVPTFWYGSVSVAQGNKRVTCYQDGTSEMFNIVTDPWAKTNIASTDPEFPALREIAIQTAQDWHMLVVEEAIDTSHPSALQSFLGTDVTDTRFSTSFAALGDLHSKGRSPGWQRMYSNAINSGDKVRMPPHIEDFQLLGLKSTFLEIEGNALNNTLNMAGAFWKQVTINFGDGDDENVSPESTRIIAYGGRGNDILRAGSWGGNKLYGEAGDDTLIGNSNNDLLDGGAGNDSITGGGGNDTIYGGTGANVLKGDAGNDLIISEGQDTITGGADADTFRLLRCGLVRTITDLTAADTLDLSDWAPIQPVTVTQVGSDAHITAGVERVICTGVTAAAARARITGATVNG